MLSPREQRVIDRFEYFESRFRFPSVTEFLYFESFLSFQFQSVRVEDKITFQTEHITDTRTMAIDEKHTDIIMKRLFENGFCGGQITLISVGDGQR